MVAWTLVQALEHLVAAAGMANSGWGSRHRASRNLVLGFGLGTVAMSRTPQRYMGAGHLVLEGWLARGEVAQVGRLLGRTRGPADQRILAHTRHSGRPDPGSGRWGMGLRGLANHSVRTGTKSQGGNLGNLRDAA